MVRYAAGRPGPGLQIRHGAGEAGVLRPGREAARPLPYPNPDAGGVSGDGRGIETPGNPSAIQQVGNERSCPSLTTAAEVSSQDVSIPKTTVLML